MTRPSPDPAAQGQQTAEERAAALVRIDDRSVGGIDRARLTIGHGATAISLTAVGDFAHDAIRMREQILASFAAAFRECDATARAEGWAAGMAEAAGIVESGRVPNSDQQRVCDGNVALFHALARIRAAIAAGPKS